MIKDSLNLENDAFLENIWEWAVQFKFIVDGDSIIVENADIEGFIEALDKNFESWIQNR